MTSAETDMAVLRSEIIGHMKSDDERYQRIDNGLNKIDHTLTTIQADMKASMERVHSRVDEEAAKARHALNSEAQLSRVATGAAMDFAQDAHDLIAELKTEMTEQLGTMRVWILAGVLTVVVGLMSMLVASEALAAAAAVAAEHLRVRLLVLTEGADMYSLLRWRYRNNASPQKHQDAEQNYR